MKRFCIPFIAAIFSGTFNDLKAAAAAHEAGSEATFSEEVTETGTNCQFVDVNGDTRTITQGDAIVAKYNSEGKFIGYTLATATEVATWQDAPEAKAAAAPAAAAPATKESENEAKENTQSGRKK